MSSSKQLQAAVREWTEVVMVRSLAEMRRFVRAEGLSMPQFHVLLRLHYHGECAVSDIGSHLDVTAPAASQLVDRLVQMGLLERREDRQDRRVRHLSLSPRGRALVEASLRARDAWAEDLPARLTADQRSQAILALTHLTAAARELPEPA